MKKLFCLIGVLSFVLFFTSCDDTTTTEAAEGDPIASFKMEAESTNADGTTTQANANFSISINKEDSSIIINGSGKSTTDGETTDQGKMQLTIDKTAFEDE